jgi:hypothetical protein
MKYKSYHGQNYDVGCNLHSIIQIRQDTSSRKRKEGQYHTSCPSDEQLFLQPQLEMVGHVMKTEDDLKLFDVY